MPDYFHPLRVAFDGNEANCVRRVGSNVYAYHLLCEIARISEKKRRGFRVTVLLSRLPVVNDLPPAHANFEYKIVTPRQLWTQFALPLHLFLHQRDYDIFFTPGHYAPRFSSVPYVSSVMDLAFLAYPQLFRKKDLFKLENWTKYSVRKAAKIVTISKYTKSEIMKYYGRESQDVVVVTPGVETKVVALPLKQQREILADLGISDHYFLYLGTIQPRKNILAIIDAFVIFSQKIKTKRPYFLVLAGKNGWLTNEIYEKIAGSVCRRQIILTGFVSERQKSVLLLNAKATFNLGIYEGFGIPALESIAYHTIPIFSNNTSLPEVVGQAGVGVNPFNVARIVQAMLSVANLTKAQKRRFDEVARTQLQKFSYEKSANQLLTILYRLGRRKE